MSFLSSESGSGTEHPTNHLAHETSPYLLQHANNPVDWYPWGPEALAQSKAENKPIFLSIGYSACHWCHVMERESFENPDIAAVMNEHFVNIKVDREERPDLDQIYMIGRAGDDRPRRLADVGVSRRPTSSRSTAAPYFPPTDSRGMPGFPARALERASGPGKSGATRSWTSAAEMTEQLRDVGQTPPRARASLDVKLLDHAAQDHHCGTSTRSTAASATPPSSPIPWTSRSCCATTREPATTRPCTSCGTRSTRWPAAASTTISAAASRATRPTTAGWSRTSRRCSTTMPS